MSFSIVDMSAPAASATPAREARIAVLIPCRDEASTIASVVHAFQRALPTASVYVYDNCSTDGTADVAHRAGAIVRHETRPGKGLVVRRMFADVDADVYLIVDGDDTYDSSVAAEMVEMLLSQELDMVVAARGASDNDIDERRGHAMGNRLFSRVVASFFGRAFTDVFSGYRVLSRRLVKTFPAESYGFEIETEMTVHSLDLMLPVGEITALYAARHMGGGESKLRTIPDGARIAGKIINLFRHSRPLAFFSILALLVTCVAWAVGGVVVVEYIDTGLVARLPSAVLASALQLVAVLLVATGLILDSVARGRREAKRLAYLGYISPRVDPH